MRLAVDELGGYSLCVETRVRRSYSGIVIVRQPDLPTYCLQTQKKRVGNMMGSPLIQAS